MKIKAAKFYRLICIILCVSIPVCSFCGCIFPKSTEPYRNEEKEVGDFIVWFYDDYCEIYGTTEQGNSKRFLVVPEFIDGFRVKSLGYHSMAGAIDWTSPDALTYPKIESEVLEKIYFESAIAVYPMLENNAVRPNLKKIMYPAAEKCEIYGDVYYPRFIYENDVVNTMRKYPANLSYYYNYENAKNNGYYFIDDCDYGGKIEFIPDDPVREGYAFGGWYKEAECINKWDFDTDTLPEERIGLKEDYAGEAEISEVVYQETILYAKWI